MIRKYLINCFKIFYLISSILNPSSSYEWDSPLCYSCNHMTTTPTTLTTPTTTVTTTSSPTTSDTWIHEFRASSSSSSETGDSSEESSSGSSEMTITNTGSVTNSSTTKRESKSGEEKETATIRQHHGKKKNTESTENLLKQWKNENILRLSETKSEHDLDSESEFENKKEHTTKMSTSQAEDVDESGSQAKETKKEGKKKQEVEDGSYSTEITTEHTSDKPHKEEREKHRNKKNLRERVDEEFVHKTTHEKNSKELTQTPHSRHKKKKNKTEKEHHSTTKKEKIVQEFKDKDKIHANASKILRNKNNTKYFDEPFTPHKIKDDMSINAFTKQILLRTLRIFEDVRKRSNEYEWKKKVKRAAENYEHKYKEFLIASSQQVIKTKLGSQKVILNAIEMSNQIVKRLLNVMVIDIDKKGLLRTSHTQDVFHTALRKEVDSELKHACSKLGICSTKNGFTQMVIDVLITMLSLDDIRFREAFDSLTDIVQYTDFSHTLGKDSAAHLKRKVKAIEDDDVLNQRAMVTIIKNILVNRNKPLVLYSDSGPKQSNLKGTLAFLEVIDDLDKAVPIDERNMKEWMEMRENMMQWSRGLSIQDTITRFVKHIKRSIDDLDTKTWTKVSKNVNKMFT